MMKKFLIVVTVIIAFSCDSENSVIGNYYAIDESSVVESVSFDGTVASFNGRVGKLMPAAKYEVKDNKIYIVTSEGILVFEIINTNTIEGKTSIFKGRFQK